MSQKCSASLRYSKGTKQWIGGKRITTLTGWTHPLHTNAKRKCVSILASIPEILKGNKTVDWRKGHNYTDGMDSPPAHKRKEKMC